MRTTLRTGFLHPLGMFSERNHIENKIGSQPILGNIRTQSLSCRPLSWVLLARQPLLPKSGGISYRHCYCYSHQDSELQGSLAEGHNVSDVAHRWPPACLEFSLWELIARLPYPAFHSIKCGRATRFWTVNMKAFVPVDAPTLVTIFPFSFLSTG